MVPDAIEGDGVVDLTVDRLMLLPGTYDISASLYDYAIVHPYDFRQQVAALRRRSGHAARDLRRRHVAGRRAGPTPSQNRAEPSRGNERNRARVEPGDRRSAALVDATGDPAGVEATVAALAGVVVEGAPLQVVVRGSTSLGSTSTGAGGTDRSPSTSRAPPTAARSGGAWPRCGPTGSSTCEPGRCPRTAFVEAALEALELEHGAALVCATPIDPATGRPRPVPTGISFTGHPFPPAEPGSGADAGPELVSDPAVEAGRRTVVPGAVWIARRAELDAIGSFDPRLDQPFAGIDLAWRFWLCRPRGAARSRP